MSATVNDRDLQLLARYHRQHAEDAFAEIVRRHLNLVYSAALRQVRSPQLAEEVAQSVFTDLARQAANLKPETVLSAWLYQVTRRTAIDVVRREARRQLREQIATEMNAMNATADEWPHIEPLLDEAMSALDDTDRTAVLLRYFENKSLREVGQTLGASEEAARKRLSRAVERLREFLAKRGVSVGTSGLIAVVTANAIQAAPVGLAVSISATAALAGSMLATTTTATQVTMNWLNLKSIAAIAAAAITAGTGTFLVQERETSRLREQQQDMVIQHEELVRERDFALASAAAKSDELDRVQKDKLELLRLRGEVGVLRRQAKELESSKTENVQLRAALAAKEQSLESLASDSPEGSDKAIGIMKLTHAKQFMLGMHLYAGDNADRFPDSFEVLVPYFGDTENPALTNLNQFEIVYSGAITNIPSPASTIVIREKESSFLNGKWVKAYGFADGHSEIKSLPEEGFEVWEQRHMIPSAAPSDR
ncbi:MAG: sigma-70 family RNA polymerase sigma factor [Verrucomicrobiae bacterium]|nr:sigma-70 family RNA polymerase sigma factor [Verrucomicrobiae bacterium]